jgi:hypothetical protein
MHAITARDRNAGPAGMSLTDMPYPHPAERVHAAGFTPGEAAVAGAVLLPREAFDDERAIFDLNHGLSPAVALKRTHEPTTMFRLDHNVVPPD